MAILTRFAAGLCFVEGNSLTFDSLCDSIDHGVNSVYNEEIKERYLQETVASKDTVRILGYLRKPEEIVGKELCYMDRGEAIAAVESICGYDLHTINNTVSCWKLYARWCYDNGYFRNGKYGILGISASNINPQKYVRKYVFQTETELFNSMGSVTQIYDGYIDVVACVFAWVGISDPLEILDKDVILNDRKIMCNGEIVVDGFQILSTIICLNTEN